MLTVERLATYCRTAGLTHRINPDTGELAVLHRVLGRDAPIFFSPHPQTPVVAVLLRLPFTVPAARRPAVTARCRELTHAAVGAWILGRTGVAYRHDLPRLVDPGDAKIEAALADVRVETAAHAAELQALSQP